MIFAYTIIGLLAASSILGITFGIYGYASAKLWERNAKSMPADVWEEEFPKYAIRSHQNYIGFKIYTSWDPNIDQWHKVLRFQWLKKDFKIFKITINKPDWWQ